MRLNSANPNVKILDSIWFKQCEIVLAENTTTNVQCAYIGCVESFEKQEKQATEILDWGNTLSYSQAFAFFQHRVREENYFRNPDALLD